MEFEDRGAGQFMPKSAPWGRNGSANDWNDPGLTRFARDRSDIFGRARVAHFCLEVLTNSDAPRERVESSHALNLSIAEGENIMDASLIENWFTYHAPNPEQLTAYGRLRQAAAAFANVINESVPDSADKSAAIRKVREAVMTANASIACGGK